MTVDEMVAAYRAGRRNFMDVKTISAFSDANRQDMSDANMSGINLSWANFEGANLEGCDLSGANLQSCNLSRANLRGCDFNGACFRGCNLSGACIDGANFAFANMDGARGVNYVQIAFAELDDNVPSILAVEMSDHVRVWLGWQSGTPKEMREHIVEHCKETMHAKLFALDFAIEAITKFDYAISHAR